MRIWDKFQPVYDKSHQNGVRFVTRTKFAFLGFYLVQVAHLCYTIARFDAGIDLYQQISHAPTACACRLINRMNTTE